MKILPKPKENFMNEILKRVSSYGDGYEFSAETYMDDFDSIVRKLLEDFEIKTVPIPIEEIYRRLGIKLVELDFVALGKQEDVLGYIVAKADNLLQDGEEYSVAAAVRDSDPHVRKRYTAAHELYHAIRDMLPRLQVSGTSASFVRALSTDSQPSERIANEFAARILIPTDIIKAEFDKMSGGSVREMADKFGVSPSNMVERLTKQGFAEHVTNSLGG